MPPGVTDRTLTKPRRNKPPVAPLPGIPSPVEQPHLPPPAELDAAPAMAAVNSIMGAGAGPRWNGMSAQQLQGDPSLVVKLRAPARARFDAYAQAHPVAPPAPAVPGADPAAPPATPPAAPPATAAKPKGSPWWKEFKPSLNYDEWKASSKKGPAYYRGAHGDTEDAYKKWLQMKKSRWQDQAAAHKTKSKGVPSATPADPLAFQ